MSDISVKCKICGKEFVPPRSNYKYCSDLCRKYADSKYEQKRRERRREEQAKAERTKECPICKKTFKAPPGNKVYCSPECAKEGQLIKMREANSLGERKPKVCLVCGETFKPTNTNRKYCSEECRDQATLEQKSFPPLPPINCTVCGEQFKPTYISRTWCSRKCQKAMYRKKEKAERMNDPMPEVYVYRKSCIDDINGKAKENGTTYGKYKAQELINRFAKVEIPEWAVRR